VAELRDETRHRKRVNVRFGQDRPTRIAFTDDISAQGFFIKSGVVFNPGTLLLVELTLPDRSLVQIEARVRWAKRVPPTMIRRMRGGMGMRIHRILQGEDAYRDFCTELDGLHNDRTAVSG